MNKIYGYQTEQYSMDATNKLNIYPEKNSANRLDSRKRWISDWESAACSHEFQGFHAWKSLFYCFIFAYPRQNTVVLNLIEAKWDDLVDHMPFKICYPALDNEEWRIITSSDLKNIPWSYHNSVSWPTLLWLQWIGLPSTVLIQSDFVRSVLVMSQSHIRLLVGNGQRVDCKLL